MSLVPIGDPRTVGEGVVQYVGDKSHSHEGGHRIAVAGRDILVQGDGRTTARNRSHVITRVLSGLANGDALPVEAVVGALVLEGATSITVDGTPILEGTAETIAVLKLQIDTDGTITVGSIG